MKDNNTVVKIMILLAVAILFFAIIGVAIAAEERENAAPAYYVEYTVQQGETLWSIATKQSNGYGVFDTRKIVDDMQKQSACTSLIHEGQTVYVPQYGN